MKNTILHKAAALALLGALAIGPAAAKHPGEHSPTAVRPDVSYTLKTGIAEGKLVFFGVGGKIDNQVNPDLKVSEGATVQINLINGDGALHDIALPDFGVDSDDISGKGASTVVLFRVGKAGQFQYICSLPGHAAAGMIGKLIVGDGPTTPKATGMNISKDPHEVGTPVGKRGPQTLKVDLETTEVIGQLGDGTTYKYWTFNSTVPGPFIRTRVGDTIEMTMANHKDSQNIHSIDLHAVTGPGGGAAVTQALPGETKGFSFKAMAPGLYVYHCATPSVAQHISNGMYGLILVEPEGGLPKVDREFYIMQGELYTNERHGKLGHHEFSREKLLDERPEHFMFNGSMDSLTKTHKMVAQVGETVRIYFGVGGPNATSSFHVIGEIFDKVYDQASLTSPPLTNVQTTTVAPGGATMVEFKVDYPGKYTIVDHALSRAEKGLVGILTVEGKADAKIFHSKEKMSDAGH